MPTYDYQCVKCKTYFEAFQAMSATAFKVCPKTLCPKKKWGKGQVQRLIGKGAGIIFKGSGFHSTDNRSAGYKLAAKKEWGGETRAESAPRGDVPDSN